MAKNSTALKHAKKQHEWLDENRQIVAISVELAAHKMFVSERRVRQLLADGMLKGTKHSRTWRVDYPFYIRLGTRGPASLARKQIAHTPKKRWKSEPYSNEKIKKGDRNSFTG